MDKMGLAIKWVWLLLGFTQTAWKEMSKKPGFGHAPGIGHLKDHIDVARTELPSHFTIEL